MKRKTIYGLTLLALTLFLLIAVEDLVHVLREPDAYPFGSGNAPWHYQSPECYTLTVLIGVVWFVGGIGLWVKSFRRRMDERYLMGYMLITLLGFLLRIFAFSFL